MNSKVIRRLFFSQCSVKLFLCIYFLSFFLYLFFALFYLTGSLWVYHNFQFCIFMVLLSVRVIGPFILCLFLAAFAPSFFLLFLIKSSAFVFIYLIKLSFKMDGSWLEGRWRRTGSSRRRENWSQDNINIYYTHTYTHI